MYKGPDRPLVHFILILFTMFISYFIFYNLQPFRESSKYTIINIAILSFLIYKQ
eukprot:GAHX01002690.1.p2 GENE.GAHX01002690.1~~GAHX01002690.1.p2  ORF type:complete len:54 (+),score=2.51 GAHX01002690.1:38-199(+)